MKPRSMLTLVAVAGMAMNTSALGVVTGTPVALTDHRYDAIGYLRYAGNTNISVTATIIAPGVIVTTHDFSSSSTPAPGDWVLVCRVGATIIEAPITRWEELPSATASTTNSLMGFFDPSLMAGITPITMDLFTMPAIGTSIILAGYGSTCVPASEVGVDGTLRAAASPRVGDLRSMDVAWAPRDPCCSIGCNGSACHASCSIPTVGRHDSGAPELIEDGSLDLRLVGARVNFGGTGAVATTDWTSRFLLANASDIAINPGSYQFSTVQSKTESLGELNTQVYLFAPGAQSVFKETSLAYSTTTSAGSNPSVTNLISHAPPQASRSIAGGCPAEETAQPLVTSFIGATASASTITLTDSIGHSHPKAIEYQPGGSGSSSLTVQIFSFVGDGGTAPARLVQSFRVAVTGAALLDLATAIDASSTGSITGSTTINWEIYQDRNSDGLLDAGDSILVQGTALARSGAGTSSGTSRALLGQGAYLLAMTRYSTAMSVVSSSTCGGDASDAPSYEADVSVAMTLSSTAAPTVTMPANVQSCPGVNRTLTASLSPGAVTPTVYIWKKDGAALPEITGISGTKTASLTLTSVDQSDAGVYTCEIWTPWGKSSDSTRLVITNDDFDGDGDSATDADIEAFFACLLGDCCPTCQTDDQDGDGDAGTDFDIETFFRVLGGGAC